MKLVIDGSRIRTDSVTASELTLELPAWFDEKKFKRGQKYFRDNRFGILGSNLYGLLSVLAEPKGLTILDSTGRSSTPETSRKRYISTTMHTLAWYESQLAPGSKSWKSLEKVRKMHIFASRQAEKNNYGFISQIETAVTAFGFMGYALIRPHVLGIAFNNREDREAFVYFWAVITCMMGVKDEYNMCLHPLEVVEAICEIQRRYIFIPILQLESPLFLKMAKAFYEGQKEFLPFSTFESVMFLNKRVAGIPGYQFDVDLKRERICPDIFTEEEIDTLRKSMKDLPGEDFFRPTVFGQTIEIFDINRRKEKYYEEDLPEEDGLTPMHRALGLRYLDELSVREINSKDWALHMNADQAKKLTDKERFLVQFWCRTLENNYKTVYKYLNEKFLSYLIYKMQKAHKQYGLEL